MDVRCKWSYTTEIKNQLQQQTGSAVQKKKTGWPGQADPTHHFDGPDRHEAVTPVAVGPGVPAGVLSLLQYEHLTSQVLLLITQPAGQIAR